MAALCAPFSPASSTHSKEKVPLRLGDGGELQVGIGGDSGAELGAEHLLALEAAEPAC